MPRNCPICGEPLEDGLCLSCGYDAHLDGDLSIGGKSKPAKKSGSHIDDLLGILSSDGDDPLIWPETVQARLKRRVFTLAKKIYKLVSDKAKYADWANRADIKAELQADIIIALVEEGFPPIPGANNPEDYQSVYTSIIEKPRISVSTIDKGCSVFQDTAVLYDK